MQNFTCWCHPGHQGETNNSFLATLASSSSEEMEAELQERVESSQKQASRVVEIYECLKNTVDQLKAELDSGAGEIKAENMKKDMMKLQLWNKTEDEIYLGGISSDVKWDLFSFQRTVAAGR